MTNDEIISEAFERLSRMKPEWIRPRPPRPSQPLHGAIDYRRRPDGVWEMPRDR